MHPIIIVVRGKKKFVLENVFFYYNISYLYILEKGIIIFWGHLLQNVGFLQICPF